MTTILTRRQKQVLDFVRRSIETNGYAPSYREIGAHLRVSGTRAVEKHLQALVRKGALRKGSGARTIDFTGRAHGRRLPIVGRVAAGKPITAEENVEGELTVDAMLARSKDCFLLRVKGESMTGAGILDKDLVMVRPQPDADSGDIVVAMIDGEATVKRLVKTEGTLILRPENPAFRPITVKKDESIELVGKVVGVFRF